MLGLAEMRNQGVDMRGESQKRALLIGSSFSSSPIFFELKKLGLHVTVCGLYPNDPCHQYADASLFEDYSDAASLVEMIKSGDYDYVVPSCNDYAFISGNWAADALGFPGYDAFETTLILHTKYKFRLFCQNNNLPAPRHYMIAEQDQFLQDEYFPVLVKPVDSFSGRGVTKVDDAKHLAAAIDLARSESRSGDVVVEQFVEGSLHSHSCFIQERAIIWDTFVDEFCSVYPYQVDCSNHPSFLSEAIRDKARAAINGLIQGLELADGLLHTQFISNGSELWIIECMRRAPGDLYASLIERSTGVRYTEMYVRKFLDLPYMLPVVSKGPEKSIGRHTISVQTPVVVSGFQTSLDSKSIAFVPLKGSGEKLGAAPLDKLGILFMEFQTSQEMWDTVPNFATLVHVMPVEPQDD
jgi:formate-dependent phosphoribosylglycinamide formyltransferase (GAR transformylase)